MCFSRIDSQRIFAYVYASRRRCRRSGDISRVDEEKISVRRNSAGVQTEIFRAASIDENERPPGGRRIRNEKRSNGVAHEARARAGETSERETGKMRKYTIGAGTRERTSGTHNNVDIGGNYRPAMSRAVVSHWCVMAP